MVSGPPSVPTGHLPPQSGGRGDVLRRFSPQSGGRAGIQLVQEPLLRIEEAFGFFVAAGLSDEMEEFGQGWGALSELEEAVAPGCC